jgi:hypothetical protein
MRFYPSSSLEEIICEHSHHWSIFHTLILASDFVKFADGEVVNLQPEPNVTQILIAMKK